MAGSFAFIAPLPFTVCRLLVSPLASRQDDISVRLKGSEWSMRLRNVCWWMGGWDAKWVSVLSPVVLLMSFSLFSPNSFRLLCANDAIPSCRYARHRDNRDSGSGKGGSLLEKPYLDLNALRHPSASTEKSQKKAHWVAKNL
jgi:hypothetical protein